jgi:hypothetical protein
VSATNQNKVITLHPAGVFDLLAEDELPVPTVASLPVAGVKPANWGGVPVDQGGQEIKRLVARRLFDLVRPGAGDESELLKTRFLCRGGGALLVGQTGQGKSSLAMQAALSWACGSSLFGIEPNGPLRVLLLQGENDDGDLTEARDGVAWALEAAGLFDDAESAESRRQLIAANVLVVSENELAGESLFSSLDLLLTEARPDLMIIDPAFSYVDGDASASKDVGKFLRQGLNPLLSRHRCGCLIVHHTPKPPGQKGAVNTQGTAYAGFGSSEWANWARAILTIEGIGGGRYKLHAAKRGGRIGWKDGEGKTAFFKVLEHSFNDAGFAWEEVTGTAGENVGNNAGKPGLEQLLELVPLSAVISKDSLEVKMKAAGFAEKWGRTVLNAALDEGALFAHKMPRQGRKAAVAIARFEQPEGEEVQP